MPNPKEEHYPAIWCRKCESALGKPMRVQQVKYSLHPTKHGAVVRQCTGCRQWWLGYMQMLPDQTFNIILKMIDNVL